MTPRDGQITVRVRRQLVTWDGTVELQRVLKFSYPLARGMQPDLTGWGIAERVTVHEVRPAPSPDVDVEIVLSPERGDGNRLRVAGMCDWLPPCEPKKLATEDPADG